MYHMAVFGLSLHLSSSESHKTLVQNFLSQTGTLHPHSINERFSFNQWSQLSNSLSRSIYVMNWVVSTKLPCYALPQTQRHSSEETFSFIHLVSSYEAVYKISYTTSKTWWRYDCFVHKQGVWTKLVTLALSENGIMPSSIRFLLMRSSYSIKMLVNQNKTTVYQVSFNHQFELFFCDILYSLTVPISVILS